MIMRDAGLKFTKSHATFHPTSEFTSCRLQSAMVHGRKVPPPPPELQASKPEEELHPMTSHAASCHQPSRTSPLKTRAKNKDTRPVQAAGVAPKRRDPNNTLAMQKAAKAVQKKEERAQKAQRFANAADRLAEIEQRAMKTYEDEKTPRPAAVNPSRQNDKAHDVSQDLETLGSESEVMGSEFMALDGKDADESELTEIPTDAPSDLDMTIKKRKAPKKGVEFRQAVERSKKVTDLPAMDVDDDSEAGLRGIRTQSLEIWVSTFLVSDTKKKNSIPICRTPKFHPPRK